MQDNALHNVDDAAPNMHEPMAASRLDLLCLAACASAFVAPQPRSAPQRTVSVHGYSPTKKRVGDAACLVGLSCYQQALPSVLTAAPLDPVTLDLGGACIRARRCRETSRARAFRDAADLRRRLPAHGLPFRRGEDLQSVSRAGEHVGGARARPRLGALRRAQETDAEPRRSPWRPPPSRSC